VLIQSNGWWGAHQCRRCRCPFCPLHLIDTHPWHPTRSTHRVKSRDPPGGWPLMTYQIASPSAWLFNCSRAPPAVVVGDEIVKRPSTLPIHNHSHPHTHTHPIPHPYHPIPLHPIPSHLVTPKPPLTMSHYAANEDALSRTTSVSKRQGSTMSRNQSLVSDDRA
jgi:hypothetical protein